MTLLHEGFFTAASDALAPVPLWAFADAPADPDGTYATFQSIGPGGRRWVFEGAADWAVIQVNVSALKSNPTGSDELAAVFRALDALPTLRRRGPPLPLSAPGSDPYLTLSADYEVST